jgi:hypothetical protein
MKTSEIFSLAKQTLKTQHDLNIEEYKRDKYTCIVLTRLSRDSYITLEEEIRCKKILRDLLGKNVNALEGWLRDNDYLPPRQMNDNSNYDNETLEKIYNTRQAWLEWLIKEYQSKGD